MENPTLVFTASNFTSNLVYTSSKADDDSACSVPGADQTAADGKMVPDTNAMGADKTVFGWTATVLKDELP